jgi:uncharacterized membrane protein YhaH (DUF805 family)
MKRRSAYWWIFVVSGAIWAIGGVGIITGMVFYPESNILGGFGLVFGAIALLGSSVFQITLVVWLIQRISKWLARKCCLPKVDHGEDGSVYPH